MQLTRLLLGARRGIMTSKMGNKGFYKGRGVRNPGFHTRKGGYVIVAKKIPQFVVPDLTDFNLKPYVSYKTDHIKVPEMTAERLRNEIEKNIDIIDHTEIP